MSLRTYCVHDDGRRHPSVGTLPCPIVAAMASDEGCSMREIAGAMGLSVSVTHRIIHLGRSLRRQP